METIYSEFLPIQTIFQTIWDTSGTKARYDVTLTVAGVHPERFPQPQTGSVSLRDTMSIE